MRAADGRDMVRRSWEKRVRESVAYVDLLYTPGQ